MCIRNASHNQLLAISINYFQGHLAKICQVIQVNMNSFLFDKVSPATGVPQGSVLSPLLFLLYINDLPKPHHRQNTKFQFADDTALWTASKNVQFAAKRLLKDLENWQGGVPNGE